MLEVLCARTLNYNLNVVTHAEQFSNSAVCQSAEIMSELKSSCFVVFFSLSSRLKLLFARIIALLSRKKCAGCIYSSLYAHEECLLKCVKQNMKCYSF